MNYRHLCAFVFLCTFTMNHLLAQKAQVSKAMLLISYKTTSNAQKRGQINLSGEEAYHFDVAHFLSTNQYEDIQINGGATVNSEKITWHFKSKDLAKSVTCEKFVPVITAIEKRPYLGVAVLGMEDFSGVQVVTINEGSAAEDAGFQIDDVITTIGDYEVYNTCDLVTAIQQSQMGDALNIHILRNGEVKKLTSVLGYRLKKQLSWKPSCDEETTAIDNEKVNNYQQPILSIYPNPTNGVTQIKYASAKQGAIQMNFTDLTGKTILSKNIDAFDGIYDDVLDLTIYPEGVYFLNIIQEMDIWTEKIILQKH